MAPETRGLGIQISDACRDTHGDEGAVDDALKRMKFEMMRSMAGFKQGDGVLFYLRWSLERPERDGS